MRNLEAVMTRRIWPMYKDAQAARFQSQGESEGNPWQALTPEYRKWKQKAKYVNRDGKKRPIKAGGKQMLVLTGDLYDSLMGKKGGSRIIKGGTMTINVSLEYAPYVNEARNFTEFSDKTKAAFLKEFKEYILGG